MKKMSKGTIAVIAVVVIALIFLLWLWGSYNGLIRSDETVNEKWANVQTAYQRRLDLIPNLVDTVQASAEFETNLLTQVTALRSGLSTATTPEELDLLGTKINSAINLVFEAYPDVKTTEAFLSLQDQLEGTENRIKTERDIFNKAVKDYNVKVRRVPTNVVAKWFGFEQKDMFAALPGAEVAPDVGELFE
ncbi:LemA family protein [Candidatus Woesearchaeota archaeon]|nr:LemA family protein [Candidatus Woesearchaeota archaeon]